MLSTGERTSERHAELKAEEMYFTAASVRALVVVPISVAALTAIPNVIAAVRARQRLDGLVAVSVDNRMPYAVEEDKIDSAILFPLARLQARPIVIAAA
jgi:hypothetical protein